MKQNSTKISVNDIIYTYICFSGYIGSKTHVTIFFDMINKSTTPCYILYLIQSVASQSEKYPSCDF